MRNLIIALFALSLPMMSPAQPTPAQSLNLGFEQTDDQGRITGCTFTWDRDDYFSYRDDSVKWEGKHSFRFQKDAASSLGGFGVMTFYLPAGFKGDSLVLKGYVKTENVVNGYAGLWLRTDAGRGQMLALENMKDQGVTGTQDWKQYRIALPMAETVQSIFFGGILSGTGKCWFDNLELLVDGKPVGTVKWTGPITPPAAKELLASGVRIDSLLSQQQQENLYVLCRTWGFLKYHHPDVAKGKFNYDSSLFSTLSAVTNAGNMKAREEVLLRWINSLGDENNYPEAAAPDKKDVHTPPALGWLEDKRYFSETLSARLKNIYRHRNSGANHYISLVPGVGNPRFENEARYRGIQAGDDGMRMLALFRYWNLIEYFFPYKHLVREDWDKILKEFIPQFATHRSPLAYRLASLRLINRVGDTHANIYGDSLIHAHFGNKTSIFRFVMVENSVVVTDQVSDSLAAFETIRRGDVIKTVNGQSLKQLREKVTPYLCASNVSVADRNFMERFLFSGNSDSVPVTYQRAGKIGKAFIRLYHFRHLPYPNGDSWRMPMYKLLSPDIGYINLGKIKKDSLPLIFRTLAGTKGIVIDIRNYPNEFMPFALAEYIKPSRSPFVKFTTGDINNPGLFRFTEALQNGPEKTVDSLQYKGHLVILINEHSQSQSEYTAMALQTAPKAILMGSQTAGADGNISPVPFPGGFSSPYSGIGVYYPDGRETQGIGIVPDIEVRPTRKGIAEGRDEVLEKAMEYILKRTEKN